RSIAADVLSVVPVPIAAPIGVGVEHECRRLLRRNFTRRDNQEQADRHDAKRQKDALRGHGHCCPSTGGVDSRLSAGGAASSVGAGGGSFRGTVSAPPSPLSAATSWRSC